MDPKQESKRRAAAPPNEIKHERIQKVLARLGIASRREAEEWIRSGRVTINGRYAQLGDLYGPGDKLTANGKIIHPDQAMAEPTRILAYHKPTGEVVTRRDPEGRPVIFTQLPRPSRGRWISIGRLDINTQGLLLVTNNGELANRLMHPSGEVEREYAVRVLGTVNESAVNRLSQGIELEDGFARFESIRTAGGEGANQWFHVTLKEGRNRIVRRMWESQGVVVSRLIRIRFAGVELPPRLRARMYQELVPEEVNRLLNLVGLPGESETTRDEKHVPGKGRGKVAPVKKSSSTHGAGSTRIQKTRKP